MKKYDVYVSYSREDSCEVDAFLTMLKERIPEIEIWREKVEGTEELEETIISAIKASSYVIFMLSTNSNSMDEAFSMWTKKELSYAKNIGKKVIPVLLKDAQLNDWFLFEFGRVDCINSMDESQVDKLIQNLARWTGKKLANQQDENNPILTQQENRVLTKEELDIIDEVERKKRIINRSRLVLKIVLVVLLAPIGLYLLLGLLLFLFDCFT